ncbi:MAG: aminopeptidase P N-terminal domain-containing protein [Myxococcaceae bacterium]|nr:aminopeptidase P N-terminal domain-containing protein [Myxococcaceae bacterium]
MRGGWKERARTLPAAVPSAKAHAARRRALSRQFPGEALVIPTGHEKVRANDTHFRFRPGSDFVYLTGCHEPDCVLVLVPRGQGHEAHLFVEPNPGRSDDTFFTDRQKGELWVGPRLGVEQSRARFAVDQAHPLSALPAALARHRRVRVLRGLSAATDALLAPRPDADKDLASALSELRLIKDAAELRELQKAIDSTRRGFEDVIRVLARGTSEREVEGHFALRARVEGNDVGYGIIAAAGAHACTLHWSRNDGPLRRGELLLLDAGVEGKALYTADITRTVPVSGRHTRAQRTVALLVWQAQQAALAQVKPGNDFMAPNRAAQAVLAQGLIDLGVLEGPLSEVLRDDRTLQKRYTLHNVSHMLGLDVHDCAQARQEVYRHGPLRPGMVLTVEPGLYFQPDDLTVPAALRGIGVRTEDDVVVTTRGHRNLSRAIPSHPDAIEAWMRPLLARG